MRKKMAKLKTGDPAPAFEAVDQDGNMKTLADYRGRKLILYFYPKSSLRLQRERLNIVKSSTLH